MSGGNRAAKFNSVYFVHWFALILVLLIHRNSLADGLLDGRIGEPYGSTRAIDSGNDITGDGECSGTAGRGNLMDFFAMSLPGSPGGTNDPWYFSWTVDSSHALDDTTGLFFGNSSTNKVNYIIGVEVNCDGAPRLEMWQNGQPWEREFAWNVDYFIAMFANGPNSMEAQLWENDGGNNRTFIAGGISVTSRVVGFRRQLELEIPASSNIPLELRNNSSLCLYLLSVRDVEGSGNVLDGVGQLNHNISCEAVAFDLTSLGAVFINTFAAGKISGRPTDAGPNTRQSLSYGNRDIVSAVAGESCTGPFGISVDGIIDPVYTLMSESSYASPYAGGSTNTSDFVGESSARTYTYITAGQTNTVILAGGQHADLANLYTYGDTNYLYFIVTGPTSLGWENEPDRFNLFVAIDVPGQISGNDSGQFGDVASGDATAPASRLVNFKGWDPDYVVELVWRGVNVGVDTPANLYAANGPGSWSITGTFLYQNIANSAIGAIDLYYSRTFPQYEFAIPWSRLGLSGPPSSADVVKLGAYTTGDENIESANHSAWDIADQSPGIGQGCGGEGCHERVGDEASDDDALNATGLGDRTPFVGRTYGDPHFVPVTDNSLNDVDTIEEYFAFRLSIADCPPSIDIQKSTNGQDADSAPGPVIGAGSSVTWAYVVQNTGSISLTNVVVYDDQLGAITNLTGGDVNGNHVLETNETWVYSVSGSAQSGQYMNIGYVTGRSVNAAIHVYDSDPSHYFGSVPGFILSKNLVVPSNRPTTPGELVQFMITVTNTGNVPLVTIPISDSYETNYLAYIQAVPESDDNLNDGQIYWSNVGPLPVGASTSILANFMAVAATPGDRTNRVIARPEPPVGHPLPPEQTNDATYLVESWAAIGDFVWHDHNVNGIQDPGEPGMSNIVVTLFDGATNVLGVVATDISGAYAFTNLAPGLYFVGFTKPAGWYFTHVDQGGDDELDSDANVNSGLTPLVLLESGETNDSIDAGLYAPASVGDYVWLDQFQNGIQDITEFGYPEVELKLYNSNHVVLGVTTSAVNGSYAFTNLPPGSYYIRATVTLGNTLTLQFQGGDPELDSNVSPLTALTDVFNLQSGEHNSTIDIGFREFLILAKISGLKGDLDGDLPVLRWDTTSEYGTSGWFLERAEGDGNWKRISDYVPSFGSPMSGATYRWPDSSAVPGQRYQYRLVETEVYGTTRVHETVDVTFPTNTNERANKESGKTDYTYESHPVTMLTESAAVAGQMTMRRTEAGLTEGIKIGVTSDAIYKITLKDIADVLGVDETLVASSPIRLENLGHPIPVKRNGSDVLFYGEGFASRYTDQNVYRLTLEDGKEITQASVDAEGTPAADSYWETIEVENQVLFRPDIIHHADADPWFWYQLISGIRTQFVTTFSLPGLADTAGGLFAVNLKGGTKHTRSAMHGVRIMLNDTLVLQTNFFGLDELTAIIHVPAGLWRAGDNQLTLQAYPPPGITNGILYVDGFTATYQRALLAQAGSLNFVAPSTGLMTVSGFTSPSNELWDVTDAWNPVRLSGYSLTGTGTTWSISFVSEAGHRYMASAVAPIPDLLATWSTHGLKDPACRADYLVIHGMGLEAGAKALADDRASKGLETKVVPIEAIYDAFNYGIRDGRALKTFLGFAYRQWTRSPRYVVLLGDGSLDYRNYTGANDSVVPTPPEADAYGMFASDHSLGDIDGDGLLEMAIGRIPVQNAEQLNRYLSKLFSFESGGEWRSAKTIATDNSDSGGAYMQRGDYLAEKFGGPFVNRADIGVMGASNASTALKDGLNQGSEFTLYIGHGTLFSMAEEGILETGDMLQLTNASQSGVIGSLGCMMGGFGWPGIQGLGESLIQGVGGASAVFGAASLVSLRESVNLADIIVETIYGGQYARLGDAWVEAKNTLSGLGQVRAAKSYQLLGDPSISMGDANAERGGPEVNPTRGSYEEWVTWAFAPAWRDKGFSTDPGGNPDGDDLTNWGEYIAGTDPFDKNSELVVITVRPLPGPSVELSWPSIPGRMYRIERASTAVGHYQMIMDDVPADAPVNRWIDDHALEGAGFYRVTVK